MFVNHEESHNVNINSYMQFKEGGSLGCIAEEMGFESPTINFFDVKSLVQNDLVKKPNKQENLFQKNPKAIVDTKYEDEKVLLYVDSDERRESNPQNQNQEGSQPGSITSGQQNNQQQYTQNQVLNDNQPKSNQTGQFTTNQVINPTSNQPSIAPNQTNNPLQTTIPNVNNPSQNQLQLIPQTPVQSQLSIFPNPQKIIAKMHIKWLASEGRQQKLVEYDDNTFEEIAFTEDEKTKYITVAPKQPVILSAQPQPVSVALNNQQPQVFNNQQPQPLKQDFLDGKASHVVSYAIPNEFQGESSNQNTANFQNCLHMSLLSPGTDKLLLLFRSKPIQMNHRFHEIGNIVNKNNCVIPSTYHNVEPLVTVNANSNLVKKTSSLSDLNIIKKEEYLKGTSVENLSQFEKMAIPTALASNAKIIKKN